MDSTSGQGNETLLARAIEARLAGREVDLVELAGGDQGRAAALAAALERALGLLPPSGEIPERLGPYRVLRRLGAGGMGAVWLGLHEELRRLAAVKVLPPPLCYVEESRERFRREARAMARVRHPGVLPILEVGESGGIPYAALEYVPGGTLEDLLGELRALDFDAARRRGAEALGGARPYELQVAAVLAQVAEALAAVHDAAVIHRDVKPANLLLAEEGRVLLGDFGVALEEGAGTLTRSGALVGTSRYLAPELVRGGAASPASDLYALGVSLYELLALRAPFSGDSQEALFREILTRPAPDLRSRNRAVGRDLEAVCLRLLEKSPARRYADAHTLAADLRAAAAGAPVAARPPHALRRLGGWLRYRRTGAMAATAGLFLTLALGVGGELRRRDVRAAERASWEQSFSQAMAVFVADESGNRPEQVERRRRAAQQLARCAELRPDHGDTWLLRADFALRDARPEEAASHLRSALALAGAGTFYRVLMEKVRGMGVEVPEPGPLPPGQLHWRNRTPLERLVLALQFVRDESYSPALEVVLYPSSSPEYETAWELVKGVVLHSDAASKSPCLMGSRDAAVRSALYAFDAALAEIPDDEIVAFNRANTIRFAVKSGVKLGPGTESAWPSAEEFFRRWHEAEGTAEARSHWIQTLRVRYHPLGQDEALAEAAALLGGIERAEILGYDEAGFDSAVMLLAAAGEHSRAYEALDQRGLSPETKMRGPMHALLQGYLGTLLVEGGLRPDSDVLEALVDRYEAELDPGDLEESRSWIRRLREALEAPVDPAR